MKQQFTKKLSLLRLAYPLVALVLTAIIIWLFIFTVRYLLKEIDTALTTPNPEEASTVDEARYALIAKKLNVKIDDVQTSPPTTPATPVKPVPEVIPTPETTPEEGTTTTPTVKPAATKETPTTKPTVASTTATENTKSASTTTTTFDNASLKIAIYNTSGKTGAAGGLKTALEKTGFIVKTVGNKTTSVPVSLLRVKASSADYVPTLKDSLAKASFTPSDEVLPEADTFDVIIMIGADILTQP